MRLPVEALVDWSFVFDEVGISAPDDAGERWRGDVLVHVLFVVLLRLAFDFVVGGASRLFGWVVRCCLLFCLRAAGRLRWSCRWRGPFFCVELRWNFVASEETRWERLGGESQRLV